MAVQERIVPHAVRRLARQRPGDEAIVDVAGGTLTWAQLAGQSERWAGALAALGVLPGDTVATLLPNVPEAYAAWLGAGWLRALEVPVNPAFRGEMLRYVLDDARAGVLVTARRFLDRVEPLRAQLPQLRTVVVIDADAGELGATGLPVVGAAELLAGSAPAAASGPGPAPRDLAAVIYTSGTTGPSKGVLVPWAELDQGPAALPADLLAPGESYYSTYPVCHLAGKFVLAVAAAFGGRLVIRDGFSVSAFWDDVRRFDVKGVGLAGPMAALLMTAPERPDDADNPLEQVTMAPIVPEIDAFRRRFGIARVRTTYGSTELGWPLTSEWNPADPRSCGRRRTDSPYDVRIADPDDEPVPAGTVGELLVRPRVPWTMNVGYWRKPEQTAAAWRNGWFHTGDAFREDEQGGLHFVDRLKDTLRRRGENVSSFEVEAAVRAHPSVAEVAVVGVPSEHGEDEIKVVVVAADAAFDAAGLIAWLAPRTPRFMIPRFVEVVDELPKTDGTLRVKKHLLREQIGERPAWDREAAGIVLPREGGVR